MTQTPDLTPTRTLLQEQHPMHWHLLNQPGAGGTLPAKQALAIADGLLHLCQMHRSGVRLQPHGGFVRCMHDNQVLYQYEIPEHGTDVHLMVNTERLTAMDFPWGRLEDFLKPYPSTKAPPHAHA